MKITLTPVYIANLNLDTVTETAVLKSNLPRARKIATPANLLSVLGIHYGTARTTTAGSTISDRWFDCDKARIEPQPSPETHVPAPVPMISTLGILTSEMHHSPKEGHELSYNHIKLYVPLDPSKSVTLHYNGTGAYPDSDWRVPGWNACLVYMITIE